MQARPNAYKHSHFQTTVSSKFSLSKQGRQVSDSLNGIKTRWQLNTNHSRQQPIFALPDTQVSFLFVHRWAGGGGWD